MRSLLSSDNVTHLHPFPSLHSRSRASFTVPSGSSLLRSTKPHVSDTAYLLKLIDFLKVQRLALGLSIAELTRKSKLGRNVVEFAESGKRIPCTREFKAWSIALGFKWEDVWSLVLLPHLKLSC